MPERSAINISRCFVLLTLLPILSACSGAGAPEPERNPQKATVQEQAWQQIHAGALLIDVRTPAEFARGHLDGAINIPYDQLEARVSELGGDRDRGIVLYCRSGRRAGIGEKILEKLGFTRVFNAGGYQDLLRAR